MAGAHLVVRSLHRAGDAVLPDPVHRSATGEVGDGMGWDGRECEHADGDCCGERAGLGGVQHEGPPEGRVWTPGNVRAPVPVRSETTRYDPSGAVGAPRRDPVAATFP